MYRVIFFLVYYINFNQYFYVSCIDHTFQNPVLSVPSVAPTPEVRIPNMLVLLMVGS
jgi:hypothetical protein